MHLILKLLQVHQVCTASALRNLTFVFGITFIKYKFIYNRLYRTYNAELWPGHEAYTCPWIPWWLVDNLMQDRRWILFFQDTQTIRVSYISHEVDIDPIMTGDDKT